MNDNKRNYNLRRTYEMISSKEDIENSENANHYINRPSQNNLHDINKIDLATNYKFKSEQQPIEYNAEEELKTNYNYNLNEDYEHIDSIEIEHNSRHGEYGGSHGYHRDNYLTKQKQNQEELKRNLNVNNKINENYHKTVPVQNNTKIINKNFSQNINKDLNSVSSDENLICNGCNKYEELCNKRNQELKQLESDIEQRKKKLLQQIKEEENDCNKEQEFDLIDKYRNYDHHLIDEKVKQRQKLIKAAQENLIKVRNKEKEKLIEMNENAPNNIWNNIDYQYYKFMDNYAKKQKLIKESNEKMAQSKRNLEDSKKHRLSDLYTFYNEKKEVKDYYNNYVDNPNYRPLTIGSTPNHSDLDLYKQELKEQIEFKKRLKNLEKEKEKIAAEEKNLREKKDLEKEKELMKMREKLQKKEILEGNLELMEMKKRRLEKEKEEDEKYKKMHEKNYMEYKEREEWERKKKEKMYEDLLNENLNNLEIRKKKTEKENTPKEQLNDTQENGIESKEFCLCNNGLYNERMGRCCRCHKIFPKRLLFKKRSKNNYDKFI